MLTGSLVLDCIFIPIPCVNVIALSLGNNLKFVLVFGNLCLNFKGFHVNDRRNYDGGDIPRLFDHSLGQTYHLHFCSRHPL